MADTSAFIGDEMKNLIFNVSIALSAGHSSVSEADIKSALSSLGVATVKKCGAFESASGSERSNYVGACGLTNHVWVHFDTDIGDSYLLCTSASDQSGVELSREQLMFLKENGICVDVIAAYLDEERDGEPPIADGDLQGMSVLVSEHGFCVDSQELVFSWRGDGELGIEQYWLKIMLPDGVDISAI
ncbi:hypothetical protein RYA05_03585 [Pseudomonas syringae pv. actinidiae]|nr:hypothetical protein [Pseudomonas syringae pv. actinidiae]